MFQNTGPTVERGILKEIYDKKISVDTDETWTREKVQAQPPQLCTLQQQPYPQNSRALIEKETDGICINTLCPASSFQVHQKIFSWSTKYL
jgi:hypothetical protein